MTLASGVSNDPVNYIGINVTGEDAGPPDPGAYSSESGTRRTRNPT